MYDWLFDYCIQKKGATTYYKEEWCWQNYSVGGKNFAVIGVSNPQTDEQKITYVTFCCEPALHDLLCRQYKTAVPGFYTNKDRNITIWFNADDIPERDKNETRGLPKSPEEAPSKEVICDSLDCAYRLAFSKLTKKAQKEINGDISE